MQTIKFSYFIKIEKYQICELLKIQKLFFFNFNSKISNEFLKTNEIKI